MADTTDPLVLDLVEWIAREPRLYAEVIETWRTSCPRLTIVGGRGRSRVVAREAAAGSRCPGRDRRGRRPDFLRAHGRVG